MAQMNLPAVMEVYNDFVRLSLLEDRREYSVDDLITSYPHLNRDEAKMLYTLVQSNFLYRRG